MTLTKDLDLQAIIFFFSILSHISVTAGQNITKLKHTAVHTRG